MKFCNHCDALLERNTKMGKLTFICKYCNNMTSEEAGSMFDERDTELYVTGRTRKSITSIEHLLRRAPWAEPFRLVEKKCPACNAGIVASVRQEHTLQQIYSCRCGNIFV